MKRTTELAILLGIGCLLVAAGHFGLPMVANALDEIDVHVSKSGWQTIVWNWTAADDGTASGVTKTSVKGLFVTGHNLGDFDEPIANTATMSCKAYVTEEWDGTRYTDTTDIFGGQVTANTAQLSAYTFWPSVIVPSGDEVYLDISGALQDDGEPAAGRLTFSIAPLLAPDLYSTGTLGSNM